MIKIRIGETMIIRKDSVSKDTLKRLAAVAVTVVIAAGAAVSGICSTDVYAAKAADGEETSVEQETSTKSDEQKAETDKTSLVTENAAAEGVVSEKIDISGSDSTAKKELSQVEKNDGVVLFAGSSKALEPQTSPSPAKDKVKLSYSRLVRYEGYSTHYFKVKYDGKTKLAYCVQPKLKSPPPGTKTAVKYDSKLMAKALYYSYGYPGYDKRTKAYVSKKDADDYSDDYGAYALSHMVLSYIYDKKSSGSDAFTGVSSKTKKLVKALTENIEKKWPEPPSDASLSLSRTELTAVWDSSSKLQKTPSVKLKGHSDNRINLSVPKNCTLVRTADGKTKSYAAGNSTTKTVKVFAGDSFYFTAPASVKGRYRSPQMEGALSTFQPYLIKVSGKQDIVFCGVGATSSVSLQINWAQTGGLKLVKKSSDPDLTKETVCYSLKGAQYGVYDSKTDKLVIKITTDENGSGEAAGLAPGDYYLKEISAPEGYVKDEKRYDVTISDKTVSKEVSDRPKTSKTGIIVEKKDRETGNHDVAYGASLEGAEYTVRYYGGYYGSVSELKDAKPVRSWVLKTDKKGRASLDKEHFVSGDDFYSDASGAAVLPLGTITVQESKAPEGYLAGDEIFLRKITEDKDTEEVGAVKAAVHQEQIKRGDVALTKIHGGTGAKLSGILFEITSEDTGETITAKTDEKGRLTTVSGSFIGRKDKGAAKDSARGALPYGSYVMEELRCDGNKGLQLVTGLKFTIKEDMKTVDLGEIIDSELSIGTSVSDDRDGDRIASPGRDVSITDRVTYKGLEKGREYEMEGVLMDRETGKPFLSGGKTVKVRNKFTASGRNGTVDVKFTFDGSDAAGKNLVVFETLYDSGKVAAEHKDMNCVEQTITMDRNGSSADTGDVFPWIAAAVLIVSAAACILVALLRRRQTHR